MDIEELKKKHEEIFGTPPDLVAFAPGRINLIGEHTDYNNGFVMPCAIGMGIWVAISKIQDPLISVYSIDYGKKMVAGYTDVAAARQAEWFNYPWGVVKVLLKRNYKFEGVRITFYGNVPIGSGLSSSAALEIATAFAIDQLYGLNIPGPELAQIGRQAEHEYAGVKCGIMDQYIARMGKEGHALLIDCKSLEYRLVPLKIGTAKLVIIDSKVPHKLSSSQYNERVSECEEAVKFLETVKPGDSLRDFTKEDFEKIKDHMPSVIRKRALHVITENQRVLEAEKALNAGDLAQFGKLMNESHESLRVFYEVSSPELDWLAENAQLVAGCYGARMTGGGFGGCVLALMEPSGIPFFKDRLKEYTEKFGYTPVVYETEAYNGATIVWKK
jgi:galactokinase